MGTGRWKKHQLIKLSDMMERAIVIIPTYNEKENIEKIIRGVASSAPDISILVVDDNSPDGTADAVKDLAKTIPRLSLFLRKKKEGLGMAYIAAFQKVLNEGVMKKIITMDADLSHDPLYLPSLLKQSERHDVVVGSRYVNGGGIIGWELWRRVLSRLGNIYACMVTDLPIKDCTGGYNVIDVSFLKKISLDHIDSSGYAFLIELKYMLFRAGASFCEVPIIFHNRTGGESKISGHIIREGVLAPWKMLLRKKL